MNNKDKDLWNGRMAWLQDYERPQKVSEVINTKLPKEGYRISQKDGTITIEGGSHGGILYGGFALYRRLKSKQEIEHESAPAVPHRVLNHWDNMDGKVERGYAGRSVFFKGGHLDYDEKTLDDYGKLLASIGINEITINNVNVTKDSARLLTDFLDDVKEVADILRPWNVRLSLAVHFESPKMLSGLPTADPLDPKVRLWWKERIDEIYSLIPDFSGFILKADSEFQSGPSTVGRTEADGANMLARLLKPYGGVVYWRCFVYNPLQDWRDTVTDRPKAPYNIFKPQDGLFDENVILQVKNGPSDFQVREPISPLLGAMDKTNQALELQITQEYTGQQIDTFYLASQWEDILSFPVDQKNLLRDLAGGKINCFAGVSNVGLDENLTGNILAQANLYAFGRLAWDPKLKAEEIGDEWVRLTFGDSATILNSIKKILLGSARAYEKYTTPLGLCWMVNIHHHYGPSPEGYEFMGWGTYHRADRDAIGIDRTSRGTGFTGQYHPHLTEIFDDIDTCPQDLLLYFYRLRYDHVLKNGKTLAQHYYDMHFEGVEDVEEFVKIWGSLDNLIPRAAFENVYDRLKSQLKNAAEWRDVVNTYFYRMSGIPDSKGRKIYK